MKLIFSIPLAMLLSFPASAMQGKECAQRAKNVADSKREAFITQCLQRAQSPANIKAEARIKKQKRCEQNARNLQLKGEKQRKYFAACLEKNEAAIAAKRKPDNKIPLSDIPFLNYDKPGKHAKQNNSKKSDRGSQQKHTSVSAETTTADLISGK